jgi:diguanylate cyclase (GGDEF)-like protein
MTGTLHDWWRQPDHYYWLTAFLAARGARRATCRLIAASLFGLATVVMVSLGSPAGPDGNVGRLIAIGIAGCCLAMALGWLRRGWPSRAQSAIFVVISALCIAAACLIQTNPYNGMFGATTFAVLGPYIAIFHTPRYLAFNLSAAAVTATALAYRLAEAGDVFLAVSTLAFLTVVNIATPFFCLALVHVLGINVLSSDIEPLTGLLNRGAFYRGAAGLLASRNRDDDRYFVIVDIDLDNFALLAQTQGRASGERARVAVAQTLRETTRHNAVIAHVPDSEFLIADSFPSTDTSPLIERVRTAIKTTPPRTTASIGVVSTPLRGLAQHPPYEVLEELIEIARSAMRQARRAGGNQAHHITFPTLPALEDDEPPR